MLGKGDPEQKGLPDTEAPSESEGIAFISGRVLLKVREGQPCRAGPLRRARGEEYILLKTRTWLALRREGCI